MDARNPSTAEWCGSGAERDPRGMNIDSDTAAGDTVVSVHGLRKKYGSLTAVEDVDFDIAAGETFARA